MRVSRIVASYYQDENHEKAGHGEIYCCYDDGSEDPGIVALTNRTVTDLMTVSGYTIYMHEGARPWDEKEKQRAEMIVDTVILYMTRYRLNQMVERMTFFDDNDSIRSIMFKYVAAMAKEPGLACIAEGVETKAQFNILKNNRCDLAQGFFFDKPLPVAEFEKRISLHRYSV